MEDQAVKDDPPLEEEPAENVSKRETFRGSIGNIYSQKGEDPEKDEDLQALIEEALEEERDPMEVYQEALE